MSRIDAEQVLHVARLARLELAPDQVEVYSRQLARILDYVHTLQEVDTEAVAPTAHVLEKTNAFREDRVHDHLPREKALANAPAPGDDGSFLVPRVI